MILRLIPSTVSSCLTKIIPTKVNKTNDTSHHKKIRYQLSRNIQHSYHLPNPPIAHCECYSKKLISVLSVILIPISFTVPFSEYNYPKLIIYNQINKSPPENTILTIKK